jgi:Uma2 family endonuclease
MITDISQLDPDGKYTYADYLTWQFKDRVELIMGKIFRMTPAPSASHQGVSMLLSAAIFNCLKGKPCKVFHAPFDVRLQKPAPINDKDIETVVQPDICIICDAAKIDERGCSGAPDLVVEIVSKSSIGRDLHEKYALYEESGVKEYWVVYPQEKSLTIFFLENGKYIPSKPLTTGDSAGSRIFPGLNFNLTEIFQDIVQEPEEDYPRQIRLDP